MVEITSAEASRNFSRYREQAESEPVTVLHYNKPAIVMIAAAEFERLKLRDKKIMAIEDMPNWLAELVINGTMDARHDPLEDVTAPEGFAASAVTEP